jgi:ribonuclease VapC
VIIDTSAIVTILKREAGWEEYSAALENSEFNLLSAATYFETGIVLDSYKNAILSRRLDELMVEARMIIEPVTPEQARIARLAYRDYGKGSGHPAQLNFGDCFSYALARDKREPILFKGDDFSHTDLRSALKEQG